MDVTRASTLTAQGQSRTRLVRMARAGELVRVRHGAYASAIEADAIGRHRQLIEATWPLLAGDAVLSHSSAAVLHGLPVWQSMLGSVCAVRPEGGHGGRTRSLHMRQSGLSAGDVTVVDGYRLTSMARTAVDQACVLRHDRAVATMDAALRLGVPRDDLSRAVSAARGRHGVGVARSALGFADGLAESVGESVSRVLMAQVGIPAPELQVNVFDDLGNWLARGDFGWREHGVVGEFDGRVKYVGEPEEVARVVMSEKSREQAIRDAGWIVVRWTWRDLGDPAAFRRRIMGALDLRR